MGNTITHKLILASGSNSRIITIEPDQINPKSDSFNDILTRHCSCNSKNCIKYFSTIKILVDGRHAEYAIHNNKNFDPYEKINKYPIFQNLDLSNYPMTIAFFY